MPSNLVDDVVKFVEDMTVKTCTKPFRVFNLLKKHFSNFSAELSEMPEDEPADADETPAETGTAPEHPLATDESQEKAGPAEEVQTPEEPEAPPAPSFRPDLHEERLFHSLVLREVLGKPLSLRNKNERSLPEDLPEMRLWRSGDREN